MQTAINWFKAIWGFIFYLGPVDPQQAVAWRKQDLARMQNAQGIEREAVGELLGAGMQHRIYAYHEGEMQMVLKVLIPSRWLRFPNIQEARADAALVVQFFGPFAITPAEIVPLNDGAYAIKQRRLGQFRGVVPADLRGEPLRSEFVDLAQRNRTMIAQAGRSLDFLGREGQRKCRAAFVGFRQTAMLSNVVVESCPDGTSQLAVLDTDLENFHPNSHNLRDIRSGLAARIAVFANRLLIRRLFQVDI